MVLLQPRVLAAHQQRQLTRATPRLTIDEDALRWSPLVSTSMLHDEESAAEQQVSHVAAHVA